MSNNLIDKNILIIAYEFYPVNTGGSHRPFRIAKYLKRSGFNPLVISADDETLSQKSDKSLQQILDDSGIETIRIAAGKEDYISKIKKGYYFNLVDDHFRRWKESALPVILRTIRERNIQLILITAPPFSITGVIPIIRKKTSGKKIILDLRDAWTTWNIAPFATYLHYRFLLKREKKIISLCDSVLVTSEQTRKDLLNIHDHLDNKRIDVITNSYEGNVIPMKQLKKEIGLVFGYVGSFYYNPSVQDLIDTPWWKKRPYQYLQYSPRNENWLYRSPYFIFKIFNDFFNRHPEYRNRIRLIFAGKKPDWFDYMVKKNQLSQNVDHLGFLNKRDIIDFQQKCDALMITSAKVEGGHDYSIAGKIFDYMSSGKPVLAFVAEGAQREIIQKSRIGLICDPDNMDSSVKGLYRFIRGEIQIKPDYDEIGKYSSEWTTNQLISILTKL